MSTRRRRMHALATLSLAGLAGGCATILGIDGSNYKDCCAPIGAGKPGQCVDCSGKGGGGSTPASSSSSAASGGAGGSGDAACTSGEQKACYDGPGETYKHGICKKGTATCKQDGTFGACEGEVVPKPETCADPSDEDCDGNECALWAHLYGDDQEQTVSGVAVDSMGDVIVAGTFKGVLNFDPTNPITANGTQIYLAKLDRTGAPIWSKVFASQGPVAVAGVAVDSTDSIIMSGEMSVGASINFGMNPLHPSGAGDGGWLVKFDLDGKFKWNTEFEYGDVPQFGFGTQVSAPAVDSGDDILVAGSGVCDACSPVVTTMYMRKFKPDSTTQWNKQYADNNNQDNWAAPQAVAVDPFDHVIVVGRLRGTIGVGSATKLTAKGVVDAFVVAYDANGVFAWQDNGGSTGAVAAATTVGCDSSGNTIVGGYFSTAMVWPTMATLTPVGGNDMFLVGHDPLGHATRALSFGSAGDDAISALAVSPAGQVLFTGTVAGPIDFGGGQLSGGGGLDLPLVRLDASLHHLWSRVWGDASDQAGEAIALLPQGQSVLGGNIAGHVDVGTGDLAAAGADDVLVARVAP